MAGDALILDTCAVLWLGRGDGPLSDAARRRVDAATTVWVCAITGFEIALKVRRSQLVLPLSPREWLRQVIEHHDFSELALSLDLCARSAELPPIHRDPADRLIIAAALEHSLTVVTTDATFGSYGVTVLS